MRFSHAVLAVMMILTTVGSLDAKRKSLRADDNRILADCSEEIKVSLCNEKDIGTGLLTCLKKYKRVNGKTYKFRDSCNEAIHQRKLDRVNG